MDLAALDRIKAQIDPKLLEELRQLPTDEIVRRYQELTAANPAIGQLSMEAQLRREAGLDSPYALATEVIDPAFYGAHFSERHKQVMEETLAPWCLGETVKIDGISHDPTDYTGLLLLWSRSTYKSTMLRIIALWFALYMKLRRNRDARQAFIHKVIGKAGEHSDSMRETARNNAKWRESYPEFAPRIDIKDWDMKNQWRWPCFTSYGATEWSFIFYGETSSKTGGHYDLRLVDDWVNEDSVTNPEQLAESERNFKRMDNLRDRTRSFNPWIVAGTNYHFSDVYSRLERTGGWLVTKLPAHSGSAKVIFDLCALDDREPKNRKYIKKEIARLEVERAADLNFPKLLPWSELYRSARAQQAEGDAGLGGGHYEYNTQLLLNPVPEGEQRFSTEDMDASWIDVLPEPSEMIIVIRCDPAISDKKKNDDMAITVGGVDWRAHRYAIDGWIGREKRPTEQVRKMFRFGTLWKARGYKVINIGIESVAYQEALAGLCREGVPSRDAEFEGELIPILKPPCPIVSIARAPDMRKTERILQMTGPIERREFHIYRQNPIGKKLYDQFTQFPFGRMDGLDTCHDLWVKARVPARQMPLDTRKMDPAFKKLLDKVMMRRDGKTKLAGTSHSSSLERWGK